MQGAEKRRNLRRPLAYPAFVDLGPDRPPLACSLRDASQEGAQLHVADPGSLPDEFVLALTSGGAARRHCRVVWRDGRLIGVVFLKVAAKETAPANPSHEGDATGAAETPLAG